MFADGMRMAAAGKKRLDRYTKILMHFDSDLKNKVNPNEEWITHSVSINSARSKFGGASAYFGGSWMYTQDITPVLSADFTVDFWLNIPALGAEHGLFNLGSTFMAYIAATNIIYFKYYSVGVLNAFHLSQSLTANAWNHIAIVKSGINVYGFKNGVYTTWKALPTLEAPSKLFYIGMSDSFACGGYIDEFRYSEGIARWITDFTVPSKPY